jgi:hypothetical protein
MTEEQAPNEIDRKPCHIPRLASRLQIQEQLAAVADETQTHRIRLDDDGRIATLERCDPRPDDAVTRPVPEETQVGGDEDQNERHCPLSNCRKSLADS